MFVKPSSQLIIPQTEHLKLAGAIAAHWGNAEFDQPTLDRDAFVKGVTKHDAAYGELDSLSVTEMTPSQRLDILQKLVAQDLGDPTTNIVALCHVLRLIGEDPTRKEIRAHCLSRIDQELEKTNQLHHDFAWADPITELCDNISFDFCLEEPTPAHCEVYAKNMTMEPTRITYTINGSHITLDPWPLNVPKIEGSILGYEQSGYPQSRSHKITYIITTPTL